MEMRAQMSQQDLAFVRVPATLSGGDADDVIIGGSGAIGVEFAYVMKNFGVDVTIVEFLDRMVPTEDAEVSKELLKHYKKLGVNVMLSTKVESIDDSGDKVKVTVSKDGNQEVIETDKVLNPRKEGLSDDDRDLGLLARPAHSPGACRERHTGI